MIGEFGSKCLETVVNASAKRSFNLLLSQETDVETLFIKNTDDLAANDLPMVSLAFSY